MFKQKFDAHMKKSQVPTVAIKTIKKGIPDINEDTVALLLKQLEKFERDKKFLKKDVTLGTLSNAFGCNSKYLSQIIYHYREKNFTKYINDLKVDYIVSLLKTDKMLRNYTNTALAEEAGFSSTQRFTNAFRSNTEMPPTFFIEELKKVPS